MTESIRLFCLAIGYFLTSRALGSIANAKNPLLISITGHQWWWEVKYLDPVPSKLLTTANEIHLPVGRPVEIHLQSVDVIHSFWVPNLHIQWIQYPPAIDSKTAVPHLRVSEADARDIASDLYILR